MDVLFPLAFLMLGLMLLVWVAFPKAFTINFRSVGKKVGSTYWGFYAGSSPDDPHELKTVEIQKPARATKAVIGSATYAMGRGTSFRQ